MNIDKYYILIAEGVTDCSLLEAILEKYLHYSPYENAGDLPPLFAEMIGIYPTSTGELKRQDSPTFYHKNNIGIAIKQANGYSNIPQKVCLLTENIDKLELYENFGGFLIFCDTDLKTKEEIINIFSNEFKEHEIPFDNDTLFVYNNHVPCKIYLFPHNENGAIEKLLLECANISFKELYNESLEFKNNIMSDKYQQLRHKQWASDTKIQEFYGDKVQFGAISSVLKPDRPVRFTIKDHLIRTQFFDNYMKLPEFNQLHTFLVANII